MTEPVPGRSNGAAPAASPTLDDLFRRSFWRRPDATALIDPPNKQRINGQNQNRLTYAEADNAIAALATQFAEAGLPAGSVIALQLPNTIEFPIALLAALRAELVVALLPQLWRQSELTAALNKIGARALVSVARIELIDHAELAMNASAEVFSIRHVFGFGNHLPDGMTQLRIEKDARTDVKSFPKLDSRRPAVISFDVTSEGLCAVPRSHAQLIAGSLALMLESGIPADANILSTIAPSSFGGLAVSLVTWLLSGRALTLHHAGDLQLLEEQIASPHHDVLVVPAPLALKLAESGMLSNRSSVDFVIGVWRAPERAASSERWQGSKAAMTDVLLFGEAGLIAANRLADGTMAPINKGEQIAPRTKFDGKVVGELSITPKATLAMRGAMVSAAAYRRTSQNGDAATEQDQTVDTGYGARLNHTTKMIDLTSPPAGVVAIGGYRFTTQDLDEWSRRLGADTTLTALPDQLNGHRLAGRAADTRRVREVLSELGLNPLMVEAFRNRTEPT